MNPRWERNLHQINLLERKIKEIREKKVISHVESLEIEDYEKEIRGLKRSFQELMIETKNDIKELYLNEDDVNDWSIAWSGGKDSTTVLGLVIDVLLDLDESQLKRKIHVVMSDTMVENPNLESYMRSQVSLLSNYVDKSGLPLTVNLVHRPIEHSYFYLILGRGYFLPQNNGAGRWCTQRLKTNPQRELMKKINPSLTITGVRLSESSRRKASIQKWTKDSRLNLKIGGDDLNTTFMAIVDFTIEDVWEYLQRERLAWSSTHSVRTLYREATGECGFTNPKGTELKASKSESCGARFGCWTCPVIMKDRSTEAMSQYNDWMKPLSEFRMMQLKVMGDYLPIRPEGQSKKVRSYVLKKAREISDKIKHITKSGHKRNGKPYTDSDGIIHKNKGTVTVEAREFLFDQLMKTQDEVNYLRLKSGLDRIQLISKEEISMIKDMWNEDRTNAEWLISNVNGLTVNDLKDCIDMLDELEKNQPITKEDLELLLNNDL